MIYNLTHEFTMLEQTEGLMQNMTFNTPVELVTCENNPQKDSGVALMPLEKINFATCGDERIFARCTKLDGTIATLSVVNIHESVKNTCNSALQNFTLVPKMKKFETAGTYDWIVPKDGWYKVYVTGGGGAGGNSTVQKQEAYVVGGAGCGGGTAIKNVLLKKDENISVRVGAGGKRSTVIDDLALAPNGGTSSFGTYCSATGGRGGQNRNADYSVSGSCGNGGEGIHGDINIFGSTGTAQVLLANATIGFAAYAAEGGASIYGTSNHQQWSAAEGQDGVRGCGGTAGQPCGIVGTKYGGNGGDGVVIIEWTEVQ